MKHGSIKRNLVLYYFLIAAGILFSTTASAQSGWEWGIGNKKSGMDGNLVAVDTAGNVFCSGSAGTKKFAVFGKDTVYNRKEWEQSIVAKADSSGNFLWASGSQNGNVIYNSMATDPAGNLYVVGNYADSISLDTFTLKDPSSGLGTGMGAGLFLAKYSPLGKVVWAKNIVLYGQWENGYVGTDRLGNVYIAGDFATPLLVIGTDTLRNADTAITFGPDSSIVYGEDAFVAKFDSTGNPLWARKFGNKGNDNPTGIAVTSAGNIYVPGTFYEDSLYIGGYKVHGDPGSYRDPATAGNNFLTKLDKNGNFLWAEYLSYHIIIGYWQSAATDRQEHLYLTGAIDTTLTLGSVTLKDIGQTDALLAKFDSSGNVLWAKSSGGILQDMACGVSVDGCGKVWISGAFFQLYSSPYMMYFGSDTLGFYWTGTDPMFIAEYDTAGNYLASLKLASGGDDANGIAVDNRGNLFAVSDYFVPMVFGPDTLAETGDEFLFVARYNYSFGCGCTSTSVADFTGSGDSIVKFTYTGTPAYDSLRWDFGDGTIDTAANPVHTYTASGVYHVCVKSYSQCAIEGAYSEYCHDDTVYLTGRGVAGIGNIPNSNGVEIFPNPAGKGVTISASCKITELSISNFLGQIVYQGGQSAEVVKLNTAGLPPGVYVVKIYGTYCSRFVKN